MPRQVLDPENGTITANAGQNSHHLQRNQAEECQQEQAALEKAGMLVLGSP